MGRAKSYFIWNVISGDADVNQLIIDIRPKGRLISLGFSVNMLI